MEGPTFNFHQGHIFLFVNSTQTGCRTHTPFYLIFILFSFSQPWEVLKNEWKYNSIPPVAFFVYTWTVLTLHSSEIHTILSGPGSSVGIATDYGLDGPGSNPGGDEIFRPSRPALGPTQPPVKLVSFLSRG